MGHTVTPPPWIIKRARGRLGQIGGELQGNYLIKSDSLDPMMLGKGELIIGRIIGENHAAHIVHQHNTYDSLVEALESAKWLLEDVDNLYDADTVLAKCNKALDLAKEK